MWGFFSGYAKLIISLLQDVQKNDQRLTMLQLVDKIKSKLKEVGGSIIFSISTMDGQIKADAGVQHCRALLFFLDDEMTLLLANFIVEYG